MGAEEVELAPWRAAVLLCEDDASWSDLCEVWERALRGSDPPEAWNVLPFHVTKGELPRKELLARSGKQGGFDVVVVTGSDYSIMDTSLEHWMGPVCDLVRGLAAAPEGQHVPKVVATCFGCQLVARALGGVPNTNPKHDTIFGTEQLRPLEAAQLLPWCELSTTPRRVLQAHNDCVETLPPGALHLATSDSCVNEVFFVPLGQDSGVLGIQGHPEFEVPHMLDRILPTLDGTGRLTAAEAQAAMDAMDHPLDSERLLGDIRRFVKGETYQPERGDGPAEVQIARLEAQLAAVRTSFATVVARLAAGAVSGTAARLGEAAQNEKDAKPEHDYFVPADDVWRARAEALLRGEGSARDLCERNDLPQGVGPAGGLQTSRKDAAARLDPVAAQTLEGVHSKNILSCRAVSLGGRVVVLSAAADGGVHATDLASGAQVASLKLCAPAVALAALPATAPRSARFACATLDGRSELIDLEVDPDGTHALRAAEVGQKHEKAATAVAVSRCGAFLATASRALTVHLYKVGEEGSTFELQRTINCAGCPEAIEFVECMGCVCLVVAIRGDHLLHYVRAGSLPGETPALDEVTVNMNSNGDGFVSFAVLHLAAAPAGLPMLAAATDKSRIIVFRAGSAEQYRNLYGHEGGEYARPKIAWDSTGTFLAGTSEPQVAICLWHVPTGELVLKLTGHQQSVRDLVFFRGDSGSDLLASVSFDKTLRVWDQTGRLEASL